MYSRWSFNAYIYIYDNENCKKQLKIRLNDININNVYLNLYIWRAHINYTLDIKDLL